MCCSNECVIILFLMKSLGHSHGLQVYQRQLSKEGLQNVVNKADTASNSNLMSSEELRDLFTLRAATLSDTFDSMCPDGDQPEPGSAQRLIRAQARTCPEQFLSSQTSPVSLLNHTISLVVGLRCGDRGAMFPY